MLRKLIRKWLGIYTLDRFLSDHITRTRGVVIILEARINALEQAFVMTDMPSANAEYIVVEGTTSNPGLPTVGGDPRLLPEKI